MNAAHPIPRSHRQPLKIILIGTSGGAQVALGTVPYLNKWLDAQLIVFSVGGDFSGTTGFNTDEHVYHLQGRRDWIEDISGIVFPSRSHPLPMFIRVYH
jgi:predicted esterase